MMQARRRAIRLAIAAVCLGVILTSGDVAQAKHQSDPTTRISADPRVNGRHLREAMVLGQSALARLQGPHAVEELAAAHKTIDTMYRTVRVALQGMRIRHQMQKVDDPIHDFELERTERAWVAIRRPAERYFDHLPHDVYIAEAIKDLRAAMTLLRPVVAVMP
jgi:hypothetical protein